jgi:hypothetical protein
LAPGAAIWALRSALESEDNRIAMALTLIAIADGLAGCRDDVPACAVVFEDSAIADRYGDGLLWSINAFNGTMWPAPSGAFAIDEAELARAVNQAVAVGVASAAPPIGCCGDAFKGPRVEGAACSGQATGRWMGRLLTAPR